MQKPLVRILLVEDFQVFREWVLRKLASADDSLLVVGHASDGRRALQEAERTVPDLILLDVGLPDMNGIDVAKRILRTRPSVKILFLSGCADADVMNYALNSGAAGYVLKSEADRDLLKAIRAAFYSGTASATEGLEADQMIPAHH